MKSVVTSLLFASVIISCSVSNRITYSWTNKAFKSSTPYTSIFLAALVSGPHMRTLLEEDMWKSARSNGFNAHRSWDYFLPSFSRPNPPEKDSMMVKVKNLGCNLIFTINLIDKVIKPAMFPEGNLFDADTETLLWSVQTKTTNPSSIETFSTGLIDSMLRKALEDLAGLRNN
ncbi:MAG: hypothetical protein ACKO03_08645 [Bacteroidota bacterium]